MKIAHEKRTLLEEKYTFLIMCRLALLRMRNILDNICGENQNTRFITFSNSSSENLAVYGIEWKNMAYSNRPHSTINMAHANCLQDTQVY